MNANMTTAEANSAAADCYEEASRLFRAGRLDEGREALAEGDRLSALAGETVLTDSLAGVAAGTELRARA